ncbi:trans-sialidase [Nitrosopumilus sp.]|nr:trans-sialidase [Nitrosopumilus sp.]MDB4849953.1 trans-sialidase [Nitrosopumilus sp.]
MAAKRKTNTKKDLEEKIAELEAKLSKLSEQIDPPSAKKSKEAPKPAETAKPKPTLPKGSTPKPQEAPKEAPKPAETKTAPVTVQDALENAYMNAAMTDFHQYRAKVTGYTPAPNRYFVRGTAPVGKIPTKNWNDQKATVTGYTQPSNQYFATRPRLAYHPPTKRFGSFSGVNMTVEGVALKATVQEAPKPQVSEQAPPQTAQSDGKSKQDKLSDYEADYLKRLEQQKIDDAKAAAEAAAEEAKAKVSANKKGGALPKGFEAKAEPEPAKSSRGTLPKGF